MKLWKSLLAICIALLLTGKAFAFEEGGVYYQVMYAEFLKVVASPNNSYTGDVIIPNTIVRNGIPYEVVMIDREAFYNCDRLTSVVIPSNVKEIGDYAFAHSGIRSVEFQGENIETIPFRCFFGCKKLFSIDLPRSIKTIKYEAFSDCSSLYNVEIPSSVEEIWTGAFDYTGSFPSDLHWGHFIVISESNKPLTYYTNQSNQGCMSFPCTYLDLGRNIIFTDSPPFGWKLTHVTIRKSVTKIDDLLFFNCTKMESIKVERTTPLPITGKTFSTINKQECRLLVPKGSKERYETAPYWSEFHNIEEQ